VIPHTCILLQQNEASATVGILASVINAQLEDMAVRQKLLPSMLS
jgi:hypothetical protein